MKMDRKELLQRLLCIGPGLSKKGHEQSQCVVLRRGRFYSLSQEIACSVVSGLEARMEGAVEAGILIDLLKQMKEDTIEIECKEKTLFVRGRKKLSKISMTADVDLAIDDVERPKDFVPLHDNFVEAVGLAITCTSKKSTTYTHLCIHIHPEWLEASDNNKMLRYTVPTFVKQPVLTRGESIKVITQLGMTKGCETENWLHFRNPMGLRVSIRKFAVESYPDLNQFLDLRGELIRFPKELAGAALRGELFADDSIGIRVLDNKLYLTAVSAGREYGEELKIAYSGRDMSFCIPPKLIAELVERHSECEISDCSLRVEGERFVYATALEVQ